MYFTDICSIAVVTLALFQRSVDGPEKMRETNKKTNAMFGVSAKVLHRYL